MWRRISFGLTIAAVSFSVSAESADPLNSSRWDDMRKVFFKSEKVVFDDRVRVIAPRVAEDSMQVPVSVEVKDLKVDEVVVFADFNPILKVLEFYPKQAKPYLAFRLKLEQSSPIRAAARGKDGVWHVGGAWVEAAGGGCTAPAASRAAGDWRQTLNRAHARVWKNENASRVRMQIMHPMDTGLAPGIPAFYIDELVLKDATGADAMLVRAYEPVSENPVFTLDISGSSPLFLTGRDNNGNKIEASIR